MDRLLKAWCNVCGSIELMSYTLTVSWIGLQCNSCKSDRPMPLDTEVKQHGTTTRHSYTAEN
jgi:hypothetical protein